MNKYEVRVYKSNPWQDKLEFYVFDRQNHAIATDIQFEKAEDGTIYPPVMHLDYVSAQVLMDSLWDCGVRPTEGSGSAGAMKATQDHLKDMRKIVSNLLKVDL